MDDFVRKPKRPSIRLEDKATSTPPPPSSLSKPIQSNPVQPNPINSTNNKRGRPRIKFKVPIPKTKVQWIVAVTIIITLLSISIFAVYWFIFRDTSEVVESPAIEQPIEVLPPEPTYSKVSGRAVEEAINDRPVYAVQIENSPEARPQSGLVDADVVYEAIAEGGITRFNAIYHDKTPANLGPIRSLRPYFIDWFMPYDAAIVHAGGSAEALADVGILGLKDIDHGNSSPVFKRSPARYSPHNLYSTGAQISELMAQRGYNSSVKVTLERKDPAVSELLNAKNISLNISRGLYNASFAYDPTSGTYLRNQGGVAHIDADTKKQISPDVVIVPVVERRAHPNRVHNQYSTIGTGRLFVFQDGTLIEGTWSKPARDAQWELKDSSGEMIKLNAGQKWFTIIESADRVSYTP